MNLETRNQKPGTAKRGFTLIELLLVMAIMGMLGTISVGGYRAMRRGMEQSAVMRNVDQFVHNAYQRAVIDRQPTAVYFWNETLRAESDTESLLVVGHAVAVRRAGRITAKDGNYLVDEFGDMRFDVAKDEEGEEETSDVQATQGSTKYLYVMNGNESSFQRSIVGQTTAAKPQEIAVMMTEADWSQNHGDAQVLAYGYYLDDPGGITWKVGDAYGLEFATLTLPNNYIFGTEFSDDTANPIRKLSTVIKCKPNSASGQISVCAVRPGSDGSPKAATFSNNTTQSADKDPIERDY